MRIGYRVSIGAVAVALLAGGGCTQEVETDVGESQVALFSGPAFYDSVSQCTVGGVTMHCCPKVNNTPTVMVGVWLNVNIFKCQPLKPGLLDTSFLDTSTQRNNMHACPQGSLMRGLHVGRNDLACLWPQHQPLTEFVDAHTLDDDAMHVCGQNNTSNTYAMAGIHASKDIYTCATDGWPN